MKNLRFSSLATSLTFIAIFVCTAHDASGQDLIKPPGKSLFNGGSFRHPVILAQSSNLEIPGELLSSQGTAVDRNEEIERSIASSLQAVAKNLVLENTRGAKETAVYANAASAVVFVATNKGFGSGAVINQEGHVITNWHVVENSSKVGVVFKPKDAAELKKELAFSARVEKIDQVADLALLIIEKPPHPMSYLKIGDSSQLVVGQDVHAIGHPEGAIWTYTKGLISQIRSDHKWTYSDGTKHRGNVIQTQTPMFFGNSGGPLLDDSGALIGITSFGGESQAVNFAVAADELQRFLERKESRSTSTVTRPTTPRSTSPTPQQPRCPESYDTEGLGHPNVWGCYNDGKTKPPDFWFVKTRSQYPSSYMALTSQRGGSIDTIVISPDGRGQMQWHYMDTNCDGLFDLVGHLPSGSTGFTAYRRPERKLYVEIMASELVSGLKTGKIPYPRTQVCR